MKIYAKHQIPNQDMIIYYFSLPKWGEKGAYTQRVSWNNFHHRELEKAFGRKAERKAQRLGLNWMQYSKTLEYCVEFSSFEVLKEVWYKTKETKNLPFPYPEPIECKDVWDLYKKIGYNHKTKKYVR